MFGDTTTKRIFKLILLFAFGFLINLETARAQNSAFTFQGKLTESSAAASGQYDLEFKLYDASAGGTLLGTLLRDDVQVTQGIFTVTLDYGADVFTTNAGRYLEISVRPGASAGAFTAIAPRQELTAAPYSLQAVRAEKAGSADRFSGLFPASFLRSDVDQNYSGKLIINPGSTLQVNGSLVGDGGFLSNLNATQLTSGELPDARLSAAVPRLNASQVFTGLNVFNGGMSGNASGLSNLNASNVAGGTLGDARLSANIPRLNAGNTFSGANNNFTGTISANNLNVGGGSPVTKILTASATLDFGKSLIYQEVLNISVPGARIGDAVYLGIPPNVMPVQIYIPPTGGTPVAITQPYIFQAYISAADTVSVTWDRLLASDGLVGSDGRSACLEGIDFYSCNPPPGVYRVVVFSFAP